MKMTYGLSLQQTQKLIMTPELRQAITILQLPAIELEEYIEQELLNNPVLELKDEQEEDSKDKDKDKAEEPGIPEWLEYFHDSSDVGYVPPPPKEQELTFENYTAQAPTLHEHLMFQLHLVVRSEEQRRIGAFLIGNIDDRGYLAVDEEEAAGILNVPRCKVEAVIRTIQSLDPPGVGARNLRECLLLQWESVNGENPLVERIIRHHLDDLGEGRIQRIAEALGVSPGEVQAAADVIRTLDPKPGRKFGHPGDVRYVVPDIIVERVANDYVIIVNDAPIPRLAISSHYRTLLTGDGGADPETRKFLEGKFHSALWLMKSIEQRRLTLYKVMDAIVKRQRAFFDRGVRHLKPMTLREIADMIGMHESTVSRATSNKYVQTPQGVFELKYFFTSGVEKEQGGLISSESIKRIMRDLIAAEDAKNPLSDQALAEKLESQGINISRRTVAKYREEMSVLPSAKRKRY